MILEPPSARPLRQSLRLCLSALLLFAWLAPFVPQLAVQCSMGSSSPSVAAPKMTAMDMTREAHDRGTRVEPACPATASVHCEMNTACCGTCPAVFTASTSANLQPLENTGDAFTAPGLTPRSRSPSVLDPPPRA